MPKILIDKLGYMDDFWNIQSDFYIYLQLHVQSVYCPLLPPNVPLGKGLDAEIDAVHQPGTLGKFMLNYFYRSIIYWDIISIGY